MWKACGWSFSSYHGFCKGSVLWIHFPSIFILASGWSFLRAVGLCSVGGGACRWVWKMRCADMGPALTEAGIGGVKEGFAGHPGVPRDPEALSLLDLLLTGDLSPPDGLSPHPWLHTQVGRVPLERTGNAGHGFPGQRPYCPDRSSKRRRRWVLLPGPCAGAASSAGSLLRGRRRHGQQRSVWSASSRGSGGRCTARPPHGHGGQGAAWARDLRDGAAPPSAWCSWGVAEEWLVPPPRRESEPLFTW